ncbi:hypothetical protein CTI12_AA590940 [Artemisia annua]|uniref:Uncharacterized protein n=1 Tax=Artemisia annua TaxID=35608 RepID=A0A2U1KKX3_ARTAN|nr:hypothetical protein CTI12_AA590940 [Artemisia annua]
MAHSSLDEYVAHWFGLNQSKYQWALDDYYESQGMDKVDAQVKGSSTKAQNPVLAKYVLCVENLRSYGQGPFRSTTCSEHDGSCL